MNLRLDLLEAVSMEDVLGQARQNQHRYSSEPVFCKTGRGKLLSSSIEDYAKEKVRSTAFVAKIRKRAAKSGKKPAAPR